MNSGRSDLKLGCEKTLRETGLENSGVFFIVFFLCRAHKWKSETHAIFFLFLKKIIKSKQTEIGFGKCVLLSTYQI